MENCLWTCKRFCKLRPYASLPAKPLSLILLILISFSLHTLAQRTLRGRIYAGDSPLSGVTVSVKGSNVATQTDANGNFIINAPADATLIVSSVGYAPQEIPVTEGNSNMINVDLKNQANSLNEVVVTALGIRKEAKRLGYSTQTCQVLQVVHPTSVTVSKALTRMI